MPDLSPYRLVRAPSLALAAPVLDPSQQAVVDHTGGPLLVLAGPGTGKTTTLVEAVVDRVQQRGAAPDEVLVLTFSRKAAADLRQRISARLALITRGPAAWTFHSFCFALVRRYDDAFAQAPRLLSGAEQFGRVRELLRGDAETRPGRWPPDLQPILRTRGFAEELRDLLLRAQERGISPAGLDVLGVERDRPQWRAAAAFYQDYLDVLSLQQSLDYAGLVQRAGDLLTDPEIRDAESRRYQSVFVDEYQDTDPAQERLLQLLAGGGRDLTVVGDPDQAIYGFRGADVAGLLRFPDRFPCSDGRPAPTMTLGVSRRAGAVLLATSRAVASRITAPGLAVSALRSHRALVAASDSPGGVEVRTYSSAAQEATGIADVLRRSHLIDDVPWSRMAVIVRSARRSIPTLRRALVAAGVPMAVAGDEIPLVDDPAVTPLLQLLRCALDPALIDEDFADSLLSSLGGADVMILRGLRRELRMLERVAGGRRPSGHLLVELVRDGLEPRIVLTDRVRGPVERVSTALAGVRAGIERGDPIDAVLWSAWDTSLLRKRLVRTAAGDGSAATAANRDLDVIVALFETASRFVDQLPRAGVRVFLDDLDAQEIPAGTLSERSAPGESVRLLTAHRSKGLEWDVVIVAGVQDGQWPDLRRRGSLLGAEDIQHQEFDATTSHTSMALVEERRLFYVAVTRSRSRLVVTAVDSGDDAGDRPSRFVHELGVPVPDRPAPQPHVLSLRSLVGELRHASVDPAVSAELRSEAVSALAALAAPGAGRTALVPVAHPDSWWGLRPLTDPGTPLVPAGEPAALSPSAVEQFSKCPLQWFLERKAGVRGRAGERQTFGNLLHAIAEIASNDPARATSEAMLAMLDEGWPQLEFEAPWYADHQYRVATRAVLRLADYAASATRTFAGAEESFTVDIAGARLSGKVDRLDVDISGAGVVIDYKTSASKAGPTKMASHPQLAIYQLAVEHGAFPGLDRSGGAELVQLRAGEGAGAIVERQEPLSANPQLRDDTLELLRVVAGGVIAEDFPARPGSACGYCGASRSCPAQADGEQVYT